MWRGLDAGRSEFSKGDCIVVHFILLFLEWVELWCWLLWGHYGPHFFDTTKCLCSLMNAIAIPSTSPKPGNGELEELPVLPLPQMTSITFWNHLHRYSNLTKGKNLQHSHCAATHKMQPTQYVWRGPWGPPWGGPWTPIIWMKLPDRDFSTWPWLEWFEESPHTVLLVDQSCENKLWCKKSVF